MKQFHTIEQIDTGILYALELASNISVLLLAFGLIASMANVLTKGSVLTDNLLMQHIWAWTQCIAIDASVAGTIIRTFRYHAEGERVRTWLSGLLSALLLFTAAIVSNIESVQQTLYIALDQAYVHVFVPHHLHRGNRKQTKANKGRASLRRPQESVTMNKWRTTTNGSRHTWQCIHMPKCGMLQKR